MSHIRSHVLVFTFIPIMYLEQGSATADLYCILKCVLTSALQRVAVLTHGFFSWSSNYKREENPTSWANSREQHIKAINLAGVQCGWQPDKGTPSKMMIQTQLSFHNFLLIKWCVHSQEHLVFHLCWLIKVGEASRREVWFIWGIIHRAVGFSCYLTCKQQIKPTLPVNTQTILSYISLTWLISSYFLEGRVCGLPKLLFLQQYGGCYLLDWIWQKQNK